MDNATPGEGNEKHTSAVRTILDLGEERMGEVVNLLLANEKFVSAIQGAIASSLEAKRGLDRGLATVLGLVNIPTLDDVAKVKDRLGELEEAMGEIHERIAGLGNKLDEKAASHAAHSDDAPKKKPKKS
jgi:hypothetical protein